MSTLPQKHTAVMCGAMVEKGHIGYPCTRPQGHLDNNDGEPHYAVEVPRSVRAWNAWWEGSRGTSSPPQVVDKPVDIISDVAARLGSFHHPTEEASGPTVAPVARSVDPLLDAYQNAQIMVRMLKQMLDER